MKTNMFDGLSFLSLFLVVVLLPLFCLPFTNIPTETSKGFLLVLGLVFCIIFWAIARFLDGKIVFPKSWLLVSGFGVVLAYLFSALFSGTTQSSMFGTMFDVGSFYFIFTAFMLMLMSSIVFRSPKRAKMVLSGMILSSAFVLIFQSAHLFMPTILSLGILSGKTENILGSWSALGLFAGFSALVSLFVIEFFSITKTEKWFLRVLIILSIILIAVVNFPLVWTLLGVFSLIIFVYKISSTSKKNQTEGAGETGRGKDHFPALSFAVVMISLLFFMSGQFIGGILPNLLGVSNSEISPSFGATMLVTKSVIKQSPIFGTGPNKFGEAWAMYKPIAINSSDFWDTSFNSGSGLLPTFTATTGSLGIISWLIFLGLFLFIGIKLVFYNTKNKINWETMTFFALALYLLVSSFFYFTGSVMFLLALAFIGVFVGLSASSNPEREVSFSFLSDPRKSFFSIFFLVLVIIVSAAASFKYIERFISVSYFGKAITASTIPVAESSIGKALALYSNDLYLRTFSQIYLVKLSSLVNKGDSLSDVEKTDLQTSLDKAVSGAQLATTYNPKNYLNFQVLGSVYQTAASFGVKDFNGKAVEAYKTASSLNPLNPGLNLAMATASFADGKVKEAKDYANAALFLKPNYVDAFVVLSQIAKGEGDIKSALSYAETALSLAPTDKNLIQYVDSLKNPKTTATPVSVSTPNTTKP